MNRSRSRSPRGDKEDSGRFKGDISTSECSVLHIENIPAYWNFERMQKLLRDITKSPKILDGILYLVIPKTDSRQISQNNRDFLVKFKNAHICKLAYVEWSLLSQSRPMKVHYDLGNLYEKNKYLRKPFGQSFRPNPQTDEPAPKKPKYVQNAPETNDSEPQYETYGLSMQFLSNLKIRLPLGNKLFISNLHPNVDEAKIREVFGLAGHVVYAAIIKKDYFDPPKYCAKVQFDHPVEAVQAISMFHNQQLYSWVMVVHMDTKPSKDIPEGLTAIGPGLGPNGEPLRGIRNHIELQPLKQLLKRDGAESKDTSRNENNTQNFSPFVQDMSMFTPMANTMMQTPIVAQTPMMTPVQTQMAMPVQVSNQQGINPFAATSMMNAYNMPAMQNFQMLQNMNQNAANFQAVSTMMPGNMNAGTPGLSSDTGGVVSSDWQVQTNVGTQNDNTHPNFDAMDNKNNFGYNQNFDNNERNYSAPSKYDDKRDDRGGRDSKSKSSRDDDKTNNEKSDLLIFKNLPRNVTLQALKSKMQEVGVLKFAEMTGHGRAIVRFWNNRDAERCIKLFDRSKVDGQVIEVRYF